jgi:hypothetical protein
MRRFEIGFIDYYEDYGMILRWLFLGVEAEVDDKTRA